jgi:hypothetical protein
MKWPANFGIAMFLCLSLVGCLGIEPALSGRAYDEYVRSIKKYIESWDKPGMTIKERQQDWIQCGGDSDGNFSPHVEQIQERMSHGRSRGDAWEKLRSELHECMNKNGYTFK